ncbi:MAG: glycosyltransferase family 2 protein [bacterium]
MKILRHATERSFVSAEKAVEFSVVVVTHNSENEIGPCLRSVVQELSPFTYEILVIDNGSGDDTRRVVTRFMLDSGARSGAVQLMANERNLGFTRALNQGLRNCRGRFVMTLNPDTELLPGSVTRLRDALRAEETLGVVAPQLLYGDGSVQPTCRHFPRRQDVLWQITGLSYLFPGSKRFNHWKMGEFDHSTRRRVDQCQGACLLFPRYVLENVGLWDERFPMFFSDVDWCKRVKESGYDILFEPEAKVVHLQGVSVFKRRARMIWTSHRSFYDYFKKHERKFMFVNEIFGLILLLTCILRICAVPFHDSKEGETHATEYPGRNSGKG